MEVNLRHAIENIIRDEVGETTQFRVERTEISGRGDYSSNVAFIRAKEEHRAPLAIAEELASRVKEKHPDMFYSVEVAAPGFLNFYLTPAFVVRCIKEAVSPKKPKRLGKASVEFISANPTGPLHIGNARGGPIGDVIASILSEIGYKVTREYYHNDAGAQVGKFADSLWCWYLRSRRVSASLPEDGYEGEYVQRVGADASRKWKDALLRDKRGKEKLLQFALARFWKENMQTIKDLGIHFDKIVKESALARSKTKKVLAELDSKGLLVKKDGAVWFSPKGEHMKDREAVVVKADGTLVYFANDIAYHKEKFLTYDLVVDEFGEGHEGYIAKLRAVADVFGFKQDKFKIVVHGQITLIKNGKIVSMAKRKGNFVTAQEVLRDVGRDAFRYFLLSYSPRSGMQFDLTLAKSQSKKNPVYYIQYAHARTAGILRKGKRMCDLKKVDWSLVESAPELNLMKQILAFREALDDTAVDFEVQRLARYAYELARAFTNFYETTKVLYLDVRRPNAGLVHARLGLVLLTKNTLAKTLSLMGVSTPEKM